MYNIRHVHLELSSLCNARCPFCPRNAQGYPYNFGYKETFLSIDDAKKIFRTEFTKNLKEVLINGNFGDFVTNQDSIKIIKYLRETNPDMKILINTNGGARDRHFWQSLGGLGVIVYFCIDGLEDTNHLYRQDVHFDTVIKNALRYIKSGGSAVWLTTEFEFNISQIPTMKKIADDLGFSDFVVRKSVRNKGPVYNHKGSQTHVIVENHINWPEVIDEAFLSDQVVNESAHPGDQRTVKITCDAEKEKSIYVAADGHVYPCCWTGMSPTTYRPPTSFYRMNRDLVQYIQCNHAPTHGLEQSLKWFDDLFEAWSSEQQPLACKFFCGEKS